MFDVADERVEVFSSILLLVAVDAELAYPKTLSLILATLFEKDFATLSIAPV